MLPVAVDDDVPVAVGVGLAEAVPVATADDVAEPEVERERVADADFESVDVRDPDGDVRPEAVEDGVVDDAAVGVAAALVDVRGVADEV